MNTSEDKMYIYNWTEEDIKFPNDVKYSSEATNWSIWAQTIKDNFNNHINTLKPNETLKILQEIFWPWKNKEKLK